MTSTACRSTWIFASAALLLATRLAAQGLPLEVRPADREQISSEPRQVVATTFRIRNTTPAAIEVESQLALPAHFRNVTPPSRLFELAPGETALEFVSFMIPEDAKAGEYRVTLTARDRRRPGVSDSYSLRVRVAASMRVSAVFVDTPDFAVSGDSIAGALLFRNVGNAPAAVKYRVTSRLLSDVSPDQGELVLEAGEVRRVELAMTVGRVRERAAARVTVNMEVAETKLTAEAGSSIRIVPQPGAFDSMRTVDSRVEARFVGRDAPTGRTSGWQPAIAGGGVLDENRKDTLYYMLRGPDRRDSGSFGASEEYWLRYGNARFEAAAGDLNYGLSPLTEPGRLGRGALVGFHDAEWGVSAYAMNDAFGEGDADQVGFESHLRVTPETMLALNYLNRSTTSGRGSIATIRARAESASNLGMDLELGGSEDGESRGGALRFALRDERRPMHFYALGWSASEDFIGPLRDKLYLSTGFDYPNATGFGFRGYYRLQNWNLMPLEAIDPDIRNRRSQSDRMMSTPAEQQTSLGATHPFGGNSSASLDLIFRDRQGSEGDRRDADLESSSWRAGFNRAWENVSLFYSIEQGRSHYKTSGIDVNIASQMLSASFRLGKSQNYSLYFLRDDNGDLIERDPRRETLGFSVNYSAGGFSMNLDSQRSESRFGRSSLVDLSLMQQFERGARIRLSARRLEGRFARTDFLLSYSMPFAMPVMRRSDVATLRGRVFDAESATGVKGAVLRLDGISVATDARGEFRFPAVSHGAHQLSFERGPADVQKVPATFLPPEVVVSGGSPPRMNIALVRSVTIEARVTLKKDHELSASAAVGVLVLFRNGDTVLRRLTDSNGRARIGGIPPGTWLVDVANDTLPAGYLPDGEGRPLELAPGETATANIVLAPERREIRMQPPLAVR